MTIHGPWTITDMKAEVNPMSNAVSANNIHPRSCYVVGADPGIVYLGDDGVEAAAASITSAKSSPKPG